jgi:hypothetical protein
MAKQWSGEVDEPAKDEAGIDKDLDLLERTSGKSWPVFTEDDRCGYLP